MPYVFLVVGNEHVLLVKVKRKQYMPWKIKTNSIWRNQVGKMQSFTKEGPNQRHLRSALPCVWNHRIVEEICGAKMLLWDLLVPTYLGTKELHAFFFFFFKLCLTTLKSTLSISMIYNPRANYTFPILQLISI